MINFRRSLTHCRSPGLSDRAQEILQIIQEHPGQSIQEMAELIEAGCILPKRAIVDGQPVYEFQI